MTDDDYRRAAAHDIPGRIAVLETWRKDRESKDRQRREEDKADMAAMLKSAAQIIEEQTRLRLLEFEQRVLAAIDARNAPLKSIESDMREVRAQAEDTKRYRIEKELREEIAKAEHERKLAESAVEKAKAEVDVLKFEPKLKSKTALYGFLIALLTVVAGLLGAMLGSRK